MSVFLFLIAKLKKNIVGIVDNSGATAELVRLKQRGFILIEDKKKSPRAWLLVSPKHIKYDKKSKVQLVWLSSERAITLNPELSAMIQKSWKDGFKNQKEMLLEFVEKWKKDDQGRVYPEKIKEEIEFQGISISQEHVSEVVKYFDPNLLYSHIENETTARIMSRTYGFDVKSFLSVFMGVLLAIMVAYYLVHSSHIDVSTITNAVKNTIAANGSHAAVNSTIIRG